MDLSKVPIKPIEQVLKEKRVNLVVHKGEEMKIGPDAEYSDSFHKVKITSFQDLKDLHFIPKDLDEKIVHEAIMKDEIESLKYKLRNIENIAKISGSLAKQIRRGINVNLTASMSELYKTKIKYSDFMVYRVKYLTDRIAVKGSLSGWISVIGNITIENDSTLTLSQWTTQLNANDIRIHIGGKMIIPGSYFKIICNSIEGEIP